MCSTARPASPGHPASPGNPTGPQTTQAPENTPRTVLARLTLRDPLPLHVGDRLLLRDPGAAGLFILGATVLDVTPPPLTRRGAAAAAATELGSWPAIPGVANLLGRHGLLRQGPWPPWASPAGRSQWRGTGWPTRPSGPRPGSN